MVYSLSMSLEAVAQFESSSASSNAAALLLPNSHERFVAQQGLRRFRCQFLREPKDEADRTEEMTAATASLQLAHNVSGKKAKKIRLPREMVLMMSSSILSSSSSSMEDAIYDKDAISKANASPRGSRFMHLLNL
jgi:hypothetical protein